MKTPNREQPVSIFHEEIDLLAKQTSHELICHGSIDIISLQNKIQNLVNQAYITGYKDYTKLNCVNDVEEFVAFEHVLLKIRKEKT